MQSDEFRSFLGRARSGDKAALGRILEAIEDRLRSSTKRRLGRRLRGKLQTSDVLQTTYLDVVKSIGSFRGDDEDTFAAWVARVLENNLRDKAKFFERSRRRDVTTDDVERRDEDSLDAGEKTPSQNVMEVEHLHYVGRAIESLEEKQRRVLQMRMIEGLEYSEIAQQMDKKEGAVRMLFSRARAALAVQLDRLINRSGDAS